MTEDEWWEDDADRVNKMCETAKKSGLVNTKEGKPPALKRDGSLKEEKEPVEVDDETQLDGLLDQLNPAEGGG